MAKWITKLDSNYTVKNGLFQNTPGALCSPGQAVETGKLQAITSMRGSVSFDDGRMYRNVTSRSS